MHLQEEMCIFSKCFGFDMYSSWSWMTDPIYNLSWVTVNKAIAHYLAKTHSISNWMSWAIRCLWLFTVILLYHLHWKALSKVLLCFLRIIRHFSNCSSWTMLFCWSRTTNLVGDFYGQTPWNVFTCFPTMICDCCNCVIWCVLWQSLYIMTNPIYENRKMIVIVKILSDSWAKTCSTCYYSNSGRIRWWSNVANIMDWFYLRSVRIVSIFLQTMPCTYP